MNRWAIAITQPRSEERALANIHRQGFETFHPRVRVKRARAGYHVDALEPLFPGYVFVMIVAQWRSLLGTFGVSRIIQRGDEPAWLPQRDLDGLRERCAVEGDKTIFKYERFKPGQEVTIERGPLAGCSRLVTAIYEGMSGKERAFVLMDILGRQNRVELDERDLAAA